MDSVWILTERYNDYDQHGEYFLAVFKAKPTLEELKKYDIHGKEADSLLSEGGGRFNDEYQWYYLNEYKL